MSNYMDFSSDKVNVFLILLDSSGSMENDSSNVKTGLKMYQKSFENFPEVNSIAVSICRFADKVNLSEFTHIKDMDLSYCAYGGTALHYAIVKAKDYLKEYEREITEKLGVAPRITFILFSDGEPTGDHMSEKDGKNAIEEMNYAGYTTVFVAFGSAIRSDFGKRLGFISTKDIRNREDAVEFFGVELSKSCKEQSRSLRSLGSNFFSQATDAKSESYSATENQVMEDTSFFDDI